MNIKLTDEEFINIVNAVNVARKFYEENNMMNLAKKYEQLDEFLLVTSSITFEVGPGLTESGRKSLEEIIKRRKQAEIDESKVIEFPSLQE
ncbi:hypothetical protein [Desulforamulus aquiferis]|uniref:Uncharacterized protein n=1 Tax=Desulforamulus aquiferis TaxID=1397668 RepID=A0AAW7ZFE2_9FIRM|nr:hypothetical protein [Desulforamulus aquiferis]MDO7787889.1 hypothetical protein [Desulforamulus aquiferis]